MKSSHRFRFGSRAGPGARWRALLLATLCLSTWAIQPELQELEGRRA